MVMKIGSGAGIPQFGPRELASARGAHDKHLQRLSTGLRLLSAADDASGLAISQDMHSDLRALTRATQNANDGVSLTQVADGALGEIGSMLGRLRELSVQAANGTLNDTQRAALDKEFQAVKGEIDRVVDTTEFNGNKLLDGSQGDGLSIQVGADAGADNQIDIEIDSADTGSLGVDTVVLSGADAAQASLAAIDGAIERLAERRVSVGSATNRLERTLSNLATSRVNLDASRSRIEDADFAQEVSGLVASNIRSQVSVAMQAQANVAAGMSLSLIR